MENELLPAALLLSLEEMLALALRPIWLEMREEFRVAPRAAIDRKFVVPALGCAGPFRECCGFGWVAAARWGDDPRDKYAVYEVIIEDWRSRSSKICCLSGLSSMLYLLAMCMTFEPNLAWLARPTLVSVDAFGGWCCKVTSLVSPLLVTWPYEEENRCGGWN